VPPALHAELRGYQREGFVWMARLARRGAGACLADDMGLGKTLQTIAVLLDQAPLGPSIVLAPTSVCHNWENELARFAPTLGVHRFGPGDRAAQVAALGPGDVLIASYGLLHTEAALLAGRDWQMAVFDEAQALKNADTRRARAGRRLRAAFRVALTGTPIENRLEDLWSLFNLINPGLLGTRQSFQKRFAAVSAPSTRGTEAEAGTGAKARCEGGGAPSVLGLNAQEATRYEGRAGAAEKSPNQYEGRNEASSVLGLSGRATPQYKGGAGAAQSSQNQYEGKAEASSALGLGEQATARYGALNGAAEGFQERYEGEAETSSARGLGGQVTARYEALNGAAEGFQGHYEGGAGARYEEGSGGLSGTLAGRPSATGPERTPEAPSGAQSEARAALRALVRPFILRRTKSQVLTELPPRMEQVLEVDLPEDERAFYEALRRTALASLEEPGDEGSRKLNILTELMKLRRACCAPALVDPGVKLPGAKLGAFMDLAAELVRGGHKALVFSQFVGCLAEARRRLEAGGFACQYRDARTRAAVPRRVLSGREGRFLPHQPQGGRAGAQPHRRRLCDPSRSVVESRRGGSGF
uniref:DEAD/DEAH box helicase n=1 Tax=uncultured Bilophila sp. TaxID=529385 RepID=UPI00262D80AE